MSEINFRKNYTFINNTIFTDNDIPLPVNIDEEILYFTKNVTFYLQIGNGAPALTVRYSSYNGTVYITNYRVIYKPKISTKFFDSFFITFDRIISVDDDYSFDIAIEESYVGSVYIGFEESHKSVFYKVLKSMVNEFTSKEDTQDSEDTLPLYCEAIKK
ncbi:hypothetical protein CWI38_0597p0020 [Hamiltosporidium tvaerminnensis]|uniref:GRAM domain-containing protein n=2 Tax=Hamiltosporidium TaxID=1176354 RepID=A0A4Q9KU30_9MICR|nr:hypothetical protein CWI39_2936p0010 [Hamiltosporidium magnivora]TBU12876.1 hypothetical protein CWI38_0597p0020 [Hamiltosporidium tvaerminnensis]